VRRGAPLLAAAALAAACAGIGSPPTSVVESRGWAPNDSARPEAAARRALADALLRAVERSAGVSLTARTRVNDGAVSSARMMTEAAGCVKRYRVLEEGVADGGRFTLVRAEVSSGATACPGRSPLPPAALEEAEASVRVAGSGKAGDEGALAAASALRAELARRGWRVVEGPARLRVVGVLRMSRGDDVRLGPMSSARADLSLSVEAGEGRVLRELSAQGAAVDTDAAVATRQAARRAAQEAAAGTVAAMEDGLWELSKPN
jgi:hypothetical protein